MIRNIKGEYLYYDKGAMVVETMGGIGFRIYIADTSPLLLHQEGDLVNIFTYMQVKEDGMSLYGFSQLDSLNLFEQLITVKGVGPRAGLAIMSTGSADEIKYSIINKDASAIARAQGVGKKTAERVILDEKRGCHGSHYAWLFQGRGGGSNRECIRGRSGSRDLYQEGAQISAVAVREHCFKFCESEE